MVFFGKGMHRHGAIRRLVCCVLYQLALGTGTSLAGRGADISLETSSTVQKAGIHEPNTASEPNPQSAPEFYNLGLKELRGGRPARAAMLLKRANSLSPRSQATLVPLIQALTESGQTQEAVRYSRELSRMQPQDPRMKMNVGLIFLRVKRCDVAQTWLRAAAQADRVLEADILQRGQRAYNAGQFAEGLCFAAVVREFEPNSARIHSFEGACYYSLQKPALAVREIQEAIHLDEQNENYYVQLAQVFIGFNTPEAAVLLLEPALTRFPASATIRLVLGVACMLAGKLENAEQNLNESLQLQPAYPPTLRALAALYEKQTQWKHLSEIGESISKLPGCQPEGLYYRAEADYYLYAGQPAHYPEIDQLLGRCLTLNPNFAAGHRLRGKLLVERGLYRDAIDSLQRAIALEPKQSSAYYTLMIAYAKVGDHEKSAEALEKYRLLAGRTNGRQKKLIYEVVPTPPSTKP